MKRLKTKGVAVPTPPVDVQVLTYEQLDELFDIACNTVVTEFTEQGTIS